MVKKRRWLLAAAILPLILAACTSTAGRPGPGTGTTGTVAGSGSAAPGGLRAVRHVWVIELENLGYAQSFGTPSADPYLARTLPRMGPCWRTTTGSATAARTTTSRRSARAASTRRRSRRWAISCPPPGAAGPRTCRTWATTRAGTTRSPRCAGPPAATPPPGPSTTPRRPRGATSTPRATTGSPSSPRSPPARPPAPRTSCRSGRCRVTWPGPPPPGRSPSSRRTCATTATTRRASPAPRAVPGRQHRADRGQLRRVHLVRAAEHELSGVPRLVLPVHRRQRLPGARAVGGELDHRHVPARRLGPHPGQHAVPGDLRQERRGRLRAPAVPRLLLRRRLRRDDAADRDDPAVRHGR